MVSTCRTQINTQAWRQEQYFCGPTGAGVLAAAARQHRSAFLPPGLLPRQLAFLPAPAKFWQRSAGHGFSIGPENLDQLKTAARRWRGESLASASVESNRRASTAMPIVSSSAPAEDDAMENDCNTRVKFCPECQRSKLLVDFAARKTSVDGRSNWCRACLAVLCAKRSKKELRHLALTVDAAWEAAKRCPRCGLTKELRDYWDPRKSSYCRACDAERHAARPPFPPQEDSQCCRTCGETKAADEFYPNAAKPTGLEGECKVCSVRRSRENNERIRAASMYEWRETKRCTACGQEKGRADFNADRRAVDGLRYQCKACMSVRLKAYYLVKKKRAEEMGTAE